MVVTVLRETHGQQTEEAMDALGHEGCPSQLVAFHPGGWSAECWCR
jgi:hypothetical protein